MNNFYMKVYILYLTFDLLLKKYEYEKESLKYAKDAEDKARLNTVLKYNIIRNKLYFCFIVFQ